MAHQLIVTSAKQGLDGISGYQSVLQSKGLPPQVANRLQKAAGYSHPFPHGDARNPVVYLHRIEEAVGKTWHVLGRIRDVGSDHTGRSNFLAHVLAADQSEIRGKKGGPAAVMAAAGLFRDSWADPPDPAAPAKTLVAGEEKPRPGDCSAWTAAGLDPGLAGDLAEHATNRKPVVLITRPGDRPADEVLMLFRDALRLVQPEKRWSVTFNTCAIQPFEGSWKAIRADLPQARDLRNAQAAVVIDLTANPRGSEGAYATFARGEAQTLPWQGAVKTSQPAAPAEGSVAPPGGGPPKPDGPPPPLGTGGRINWGKRLGEGTDSEPGTLRPPPLEESRVPGWLWPVLGTAGVVLFLLLLTGFVYRDEIAIALRPKQAEQEVADGGEPPPMRPAPPPGPTAEERAAEELRQRQERLARAREELVAARQGRTPDQIREQAKQLQKDIDGFRSGEPPDGKLEIREADGTDPRQAAAEAIAALDRADKVLSRPADAPDLVEELGAAARQLAAAVTKLKAAADRVPQLVEQEREKRSADMQREQNEKQRVAFASFKELAQEIELPLSKSADLADLGTTRFKAKPDVDLGALDASALLEPTFKLAVPAETIDGSPFEPTIVKADENQKRWEVQYIPVRAVGLDRSSPKSTTIAALVNKDGRLWFEVERGQLETPAVAILRRCVILAEAQDPDSKQKQVREIRLLKPTRVGPLRLDATAGRQQLKIPGPSGLFRRDGGSNLMLPVSGLEVQARFGDEERTIRFPEQAKKGSPGIWSETIDVKELGNGLRLAMRVALSLPEATLACTPDLRSPQGGQEVDIKTLATFGQGKKPFEGIEAAFRKRVGGCKFRKYGMQDGEVGVRSWLKTQLAPGPNMPLEVIGHATIYDSLDQFFRGRYQEQDDKLKRDYERKRAAAKKEDKDKVKRDSPMPPEYFNGVEGWLDACRGAKEEQWDAYFVKPLDAWAEWFWDEKFMVEWKRRQELAEALRGQLMEVQLLEITSVARDSEGREYRVPLVVFDPAATVALGGPPRSGPRASDPAAKPADQAAPIGFPPRP